MTPPTHARSSASRYAADDPVSSRILVLDREGERQGLLVDAVTRAGAQPVVVHTAAEAYELLHAARALLVGELPDRSASGFVASARPDFPDLAIVAVATQTGEATDLYHAGADTVTALPLDPDLLGAKLTGALRRTRAPRATGQ